MNKKGFTYVEVLIAMVIIFAFYEFFLQLNQFNYKFRNKNDEINKMTMIAQGVMEVYKEKGKTEALNYGQGYTISITEDYNTGYNHVKKIIVIVSPKISGLSNVSIASYCYTSGYFKLVAKHSGKVLEVPGSSTSDGTVLAQRTWNGKNNQRWSFNNLGTGYFNIINKNSGKYMDVDGASTADGANIIQYTGNGGNNQQWMLEDAGDNYYYIKARHSGKYMDVDGASTADGANIIQWTKNSQDNQKWKKEEVKDIAAILFSDRFYAGYSIILEEGEYTLSQLQALGMTDNDISSVQVINGYKLIMYDNNNFSGFSVTKTSSDNQLTNDQLNNKLTSCKVTKNN